MYLRLNARNLSILLFSSSIHPFFNNVTHPGRGILMSLLSGIQPQFIHSGHVTISRRKSMEMSINGELNMFLKEECKLVELLKDCAKRKDLCKGEAIHADISKNALHERNPYITSSLINMYAKCGVLSKAQKLHDNISFRSLVSWNTLIAGYAQHGKGKEALRCLDQMQRDGFLPDAITFICILKVCATIGAISKGKQIHGEILRQGSLKDDVMLGSALVDMYAKFGMLMTAKQVLEELPARDVVSWSALIAGYVKQGQGHEALYCFEQMQGEGLSPDAITFSCILKACGSTGAIEKGRKVHNEIINLGLLQKNIILGTALVDMYAKCGVLSKAQEIHDGLLTRSVVSWNALIAGYVQYGKDLEALSCFKQMQTEGINPEEITFVCILKACSNVGDIDTGKYIHEEIVTRGMLTKNIILGTALVDMYAKCGMLVKARKVLEGLPIRDMLSWSALIAGYAQHNEGHEALSCFEKMQNEGFVPDATTFACILKACGSIGTINKGKYIHEEIRSLGLLEDNIILGTALVDMYAKCGALGIAKRILESLPMRDVVSWNALIAGHAQQGQVHDALKCFHQMEDEGLSPNGISFLSVLTACSHSGMLDEAQIFYNNMTKKYNIKPDLEHYTCMVVVSGCGGQLGKAMSVIKAMPSSDYPSVWLALLVSCKKWGNVRLARLAYDHIVQLDTKCTAAHVLMERLYAAVGMKEDAEKIKAKGVENADLQDSGDYLLVDGSGNAFLSMQHVLKVQI